MESQNTPNRLSDVDVVAGAQSSNIQENNGGSNRGPSVESTHPQTSADSQAQQYEDNDVLMDFDDYNEMPSLQDVSDSSSSEDESESDRDANEVEMQVDNSYDNDGRPPLVAADNAPPASSFSNYRPSPIQATMRSNSNRRARVEDDDDDERDRRHPSQRINNGNRNDTSATPSSSQTSAQMPQNQPNVQTNNPLQGPSTQRPTPPFHHHIIRATLSGNIDPNNHPFRFFRHLMPPDNNNNMNNTLGQNNNPTVPDNNNNDGAQPQPQQPQPQGGNNNGRSMFEGLAFSVEIGPGFHIHPGQDQAGEPGAQNVDGQTPPGANLPPRTGTFADIISMLGRLGGGVDGEAILNLGNLGLGLGMPQEKDDPERAKRLVDGLEEVPVGLVRRLERVGGAAGGVGGEPANGGDAGCAICWDKLLDSDGEGFGKEERASNDEEDREEGSSSQTKEENSQPKIVSLPCAHVFHADCLLPWFARPRHTTCPTCRFNIDPEDLTHASMRRRRERRERNATQPAGQTEGEDLNEGDGPQPVHIIDGDDFIGPHHVGNLFAPQADAQLQNNLRQFFGPPNGQQNPRPQPGPADAAATVPNPATAGSSNVANPTAQSNPATTTTSSIATTTPAPRLPGATSTTIQTPHGRVGIIQVPIPVMVPFVLPTMAPGQTPAAGAALNNPNGALPGVHTAEITRLLQRIMGRGVQQPPPPQPQGAQANPQVGNVTNAANGGAFPATQAPLPLFGGNQNSGPQPGTTNPPPAAANTPAQGAHNPANTAGAGMNQLPSNHRQGVMEIRVDMVFGGDPFGGQFLGGNHQGGQAAGAGDVNDFLANGIEAAVNAAAESGDPVQAAHAARHRELEQRLSDLMEMRQRLDAQAAAFGVQLPSHQPEGQAAADPQQPQQPQQQHLPFGNLAGLAAGPGMHFTGTGRSVSEAFARMFGGMQPVPPQGQGQAGPGANPEAEGGQQNAPPVPEGDNHAPPLPQEQQHAFQMPLGGNGAPLNIFPNLADLFGGGMPERRRPRPYKEWSLPPPPGPTLRQRIERREREAGLRCYDVSCGIGPSDEDPFGTELGEAAARMNQLSIMSKDDRSELCPHTFHGPCLVSAERVALRGADAIVEKGNVEVSCPVCRGTGCVSKKEWDEGVVSLQ